MICYLDIEHEVALTRPEEREAHRAHNLDVRRRLEAASGLPCQVKAYGDLTLDWLKASGAQALVIGGNVTDWSQYDPVVLERLCDVVRAVPVPILGTCGGFQLIGMAHDAPLGPIRRLRPGETDPEAGYAGGYLKEWGFVPVRVVKPDPLFSGLGPQPVFLEAHYWEVRQVPMGFDLLASTEICRVQAIRQVGKPVYGVQFHPEAYIAPEGPHRSWLIDLVYPEGYDAPQPAGRRLLENFFGGWVV
ncbi:MAG: gamma-glutamyl-gamma-aminobutyrate hydrolase family protein [Anaerolineae bacterium]